MSLESKVAVVTGAANGIGRATTLEFARAGASLVLVDLDEPALAETARAASEAGVQVRECAGDVSRSDDVLAYVAAAKDAFGSIDVFFNNAGIGGWVGPIWECPEEEFDRVIAVNLRGVFLGLRHVLPVMIEQRSGSVINTASMAGVLGLPRTSGYNAAKHGVVGLTKTAAVEAGQYGVRVNCVCPGLIETALHDRLLEKFNPEDPAAEKRAMTELVPMKRLGEPEEIATVVRFLASDESSYVNGAAWLIDAGFTAV